MNKTFVASTVALLMPLCACATADAQTEKSESRLTREQQAAKTEVWEPVPEVVSFDKAGVPGVLTVKPGTGDIKTKAEFCDVQLHVEWKAPQPEAGMEGQQRNNSGIFLQQRYEIQVLDSYQNKTYPNGQAASVYKQTIPLVNAMKAPGEWQTYDIIYKAPTFNGEELATKGYVTVIHNGVVVQNHTEIQGTTEWIGAPKYKAHGCAPLQLQDHGNLVSFKNMWVRPL